MDLLRSSYVGNESTERVESDDNDDEPREITSLAVANVVPDVAIVEKPSASSWLISSNTKVLTFNPRCDELFKPEAGPSNPFKTDEQKAHKNMMTGFVEPAHVNAFHFERELQSYLTMGYARDPTAGKDSGFIGDKDKAVANRGATTMDTHKTGGEKRKRVSNYNSSDVEGYTGPWSRFENEKAVANPSAELQKEMDEITEKRRLASKKFKAQKDKEEGIFDELVTIHAKDTSDYQGRSFLSVPSYTGVNLREDYVPPRCYVPKRQVHVYRGHNRGVNAIRWFPKSAHLFLSCAMDNKIKLWEVYNKRSVLITYEGHRLPVRDVAFNFNGDSFASASYDKYVKVWDVETGKAKHRFTTGHIPLCVKFHPDEDKTHMLVAGMQNKRIVQWDTRSGDIVQEYDRHLGPVNSITFFDKNRRFCSTSDDKSIRIWEWEIPVDTKIIQNVGLNSIPTMTKDPNNRWIVGQSMDSRIVLFQLLDDKMRYARKKAFRGHNSAGYACAVDFSPDVSFIVSGDADGKVFIWNWANHQVAARWAAHDHTVIASLWHPHEKSRILTASWDSTIKMWE